MPFATDSPLPRVRSVEVIPFEQQGRRGFYVRDPLVFAPQPLVLGTAGLLILSLLDGRHSIDQVRAVVQRQFPGSDVGAAEIRHLLATLSKGCYLDDHVAAARIARVCADFERADVRPAWHAGTAYPRDPRQLAALLDRLFTIAPSAPAAPESRAAAGRPLGAEPSQREHRDGDHGGGGAEGGELVAIMCPHIDLRAGGEIYPPAFTALAAAASGARPFDLYVILGVAHNGGNEPGKSFAIACDKHYATPFGQVRTSRRLVEDWSRRAGRDVTGQQWLHRTEHSVEFPLLFLQYIQAQAELPPYEVVPVLLGSVDPYLRAGSDPLRAAEVAGELAALRAAVAASGKRALYLLSVDLAHVGPKFGDPEPIDDAAAANCQQADRHLLEYAQRFDAAGFTRALHADGNGRNVDAVSGLFSLYPLLAGAECRGSLLCYGQNRQPDTGSLVSYASMAFYRTAPAVGRPPRTEPPPSPSTGVVP